MSKHELVDPTPSDVEIKDYHLKAFRGVELGLGQKDEMASMAEKLSQRYQGFLVFVQSGPFLHGYNRTAYTLHVLKKYKLRLVGNELNPQLRVGFPVSNYKKRLWSVVDEYEIPYVVAIGSKERGFTVYVSEKEGSNALMSLPEKNILDTILELKQHKKLNTAAAKQLLEHPEMSNFKLKSQAEELDLLVTHDLIRLPRDVRDTWGKNVRECLCRILLGVYGYGMSQNKRAILLEISANVDLLKHYFGQLPKIQKVKKGLISFEHRVGSAVELGKLTGGLLKIES